MGGNLSVFAHNRGRPTDFILHRRKPSIEDEGLPAQYTPIYPVETLDTYEASLIVAREIKRHYENHQRTVFVIFMPKSWSTKRAMEFAYFQDQQLRVLGFWNLAGNNSHLYYAHFRVANYPDRPAIAEVVEEKPAPAELPPPVVPEQHEQPN